MKKHVVLISIFLFMTLPSVGVAAEAVGQPGAGDQRAACDAGCRDNYQNNAAALQACLRDCGAVGPASAGGAMAPAHEAAHTVQQTTKGKPSKEQSSFSPADQAAPPPVPSKTSNLNLSKSNINRVSEPAGAGAQPLGATTVQSSKSNSSDRMAAPETPPPVEGTAVKGSKSNSSESPPDAGEPPPAEQENNPPADG